MTDLISYFEERKKYIENEFSIFQNKDLHETIGTPMSLGQSQFVNYLIPSILEVLETFAKEIELLKISISKTGRVSNVPQKGKSAWDNLK